MNCLANSQSNPGHFCAKNIIDHGLDNSAHFPTILRESVTNKKHLVLRKLIHDTSLLIFKTCKKCHCHRQRNLSSAKSRNKTNKTHKRQVDTDPEQ